MNIIENGMVETYAHGAMCDIDASSPNTVTAMDKNDENWIVRYKYVSHYTSFDALFAMLEHYRATKSLARVFHFRASNIYKMNDPKEMVFGYNAVKHFLNEYDQNHNIPDSLRLSEVYNCKTNEEACKEEFLKGKEISLDNGHIPYSISFSAKNDYLPMWSLYGQKGKGVCLNFDTNKLQKYVLDLGTDYELNEVAYSIDGRKNDLENLFDFSYKDYLNNYKIKKVPSIKEKIGELADICLIVSPYFKYQDYEYEKEIRLTYLKHFPIKIQYNDPYNKMGYHKVEPYVLIPIPIDSMRIIIGPDANYMVMKHILELELVNCGLNPNIIEQSKISFRSSM